MIPAHDVHSQIEVVQVPDREPYRVYLTLGDIRGLDFVISDCFGYVVDLIETIENDPPALVFSDHAAGATLRVYYQERYTVAPQAPETSGWACSYCCTLVRSTHERCPSCGAPQLAVVAKVTHTPPIRYRKKRRK